MPKILLASPRLPSLWADSVPLTVEFAVAAGPVPLIRSLMTSFLGGAPDGMLTFGLVFRAAGSGVLLVEVADALDVELLTVAVLVAAVAPAEGAVWMSGSRWRDRAVLRTSVSNWSTDDQDVATSLDAVRRAVAAVDHK